MSCAAVTRKRKPDSYLTSSHSSGSVVDWCGHISIASIRTDKLDVLLLINGSEKHDSPKIDVPLLAEQASGLESPQLRDLLPNDLPYQHFDKILQFPPTKILLLEIMRFSNAEYGSSKTRAMETLMTLVTRHQNLDTMADLTRNLDYEATDSPSKKVLRSLNKCRSLVLRLRDEVAHLNFMVKNEADISHDILGQALIAASPNFAWIPKSTIVLEKKDMRKSHESERKIGKEQCVRRVPDSEDAVDQQLEPKSPKNEREHSTSVIVRLLHRLDQKADRLSHELRESFLTLTTAISIEDAEFNKKRAKRSTMLTLLAAIYLPLTLATGLFGMNIQEINGGSPRWWTVVVVTTVLFIPSAAFISLLFDGDLTSITRKIKR